jgi:hypothetical protein
LRLASLIEQMALDGKAWDLVETDYLFDSSTVSIG